MLIICEKGTKLRGRLSESGVEEEGRDKAALLVSL